MHVQGDLPSRAPHAERFDISINTLYLATPILKLPQGFISNFEKDVKFGIIYRFMKGKLPHNQISLARLTKLSKHLSLTKISCITKA